MPAQLQLQVPKSAWSEIEKLLSIPLDKFRRLVNCIEAAKPAPDIEDLAESCAEDSGVSRNDIRDVLTVIINLRRLHNEPSESTDKVLDAFELALSRSEFPDWSAGKSESWRERRPLLAKLLKPDNAITTMAKVRALLFESQCLLSDSMVLTDVRHVYNEAADEIVGGLILHTLSLEYLEGGQIRQIHIMMTSEEAAKLSRQLKRDQDKSKAAIKLLTDQKLPELTPKRNPET
jgi:hypothetical protein